jgi:signal peptidase I
MRALQLFAVLVGMSLAFAAQSPQGVHEPSLKPGETSFAITSDSMAPTLISGDRIVLDVLYYRSHAPRPGDLVVLRVPHDQPMPDRVISVQPMLAKRVVAIAGDVVSLSGKTLRVNGMEVSEPYAHYEPVGGVAESGDFGPVKVPPGHYFALGDNRSHSLDSRAFGAISSDTIVGKPLYIHESSDTSRIGRAVH